MNNLSMRSKENAFCRVRHLTAYACITLLVLVLAGTANYAYGQTIPLYTYCFDRYSYSQCNDYGAQNVPEPGFESLLGHLLAHPIEGYTVPLYTYCFDRYSYSQCNDYGVNTEPEPGFFQLLGHLLPVGDPPFTAPLYTYCFDRYSYSQCNDYGASTEPEPGFESLLGYMLVSPR